MLEWPTEPNAAEKSSEDLKTICCFQQRGQEVSVVAFGENHFMRKWGKSGFSKLRSLVWNEEVLMNVHKFLP